MYYLTIVTGKKKGITVKLLQISLLRIAKAGVKRYYILKIISVKCEQYTYTIKFAFVANIGQPEIWLRMQFLIFAFKARSILSFCRLSFQTSF